MDLRRCCYAREMVEPTTRPDATGGLLPHRFAQCHHRSRPPNIVGVNFLTSTGILPNGAPTGGIFSDVIQRDPVTVAILSVTATLKNVQRIITAGLA